MIAGLWTALWCLPLTCVSHMNDYPLIHSHLPPTFYKKTFLFTEFCVTLHVNINHICNKYVTYYKFGTSALCRFLISFQRANWCKISFIRDKSFKEKWMLYFWYLHQYPCYRLIHFQTKKYYLLHDKCFFFISQKLRSNMQLRIVHQNRFWNI